MKVEILEPKGYCAGVTNAINIALKAKQEHQDEDVYVLGMLVHNEQVISYLENKGIKILSNHNLINSVDKLPDGAVTVFTAHGHDIALDTLSKIKKFVVYDAICPKVKQNIELILKSVKNGRQVIYIGVSHHPEAEAALSISENVLLFDIKGEFDFSKVKDKAPLVINQTTLNVLELKEVHNSILDKIPSAQIENEICNATRTRQESIKNISDDADLIIVVGDKKSSNTNRLLEIAKATHPNIESIMISKLDELDKNILQNKNHVVLSSGASTPLESINVIYDYLINY